jgi:hypothetical protein
VELREKKRKKKPEDFQIIKIANLYLLKNTV